MRAGGAGQPPAIGLLELPINKALRAAGFGNMATDTLAVIETRLDRAAGLNNHGATVTATANAAAAEDAGNSGYYCL